ncbi:hypothetical protein [Polyangium aurulentum]|uniref:hypothetical protein n=1 Tax=Polyangium aurulentum TaxID=2567896 RepID=UPI0010AED8FC|nr:hypothetical protein [Polyangium aurulentum]UQA62708.1 hypothetical protein E8A73_020545 [Polyangium aurulentum]
MAPPAPRHHLLCVGVPGAPDVATAEFNARGVFRLLTGALGPPDIRATCLLGAEATSAATLGALDASAAAPSPFHLLYFSGKADPRGLSIADGVLDPGALQRHFDRTAATRSLLLLDAPPASNEGGAALPPWLEELATARPALGIFAARAAHVESPAQSAGHSPFTAALLLALQQSTGDIEIDGVQFVSDRTALSEATAILRQHWAEAEAPLELGAFGDIPLVRSQMAAPLGTAEILGLSVGSGLSAHVRHLLRGRRHLPTLLHYALVDPSDDILAEGSVPLAPEEDVEQQRTRIRVPARVLRDHTIWGPMLDVHQAVHLRWRITVRDTLGRLLAKKTYGHEYDRLPSTSKKS